MISGKWKVGRTYKHTHTHTHTQITDMHTSFPIEDKRDGSGTIEREETLQVKGVQKKNMLQQHRKGGSYLGLCLNQCKFMLPQRQDAMETKQLLLQLFANSDRHKTQLLTKTLRTKRKEKNRTSWIVVRRAAAFRRSLEDRTRCCFQLITIPIPPRLPPTRSARRRMLAKRYNTPDSRRAMKHVQKKQELQREVWMWARV